MGVASDSSHAWAAQYNFGDTLRLARSQKAALVFCVRVSARGRVIIKVRIRVKCAVVIITVRVMDTVVVRVRVRVRVRVIGLWHRRSTVQAYRV